MSCTRLSMYDAEVDMGMSVLARVRECFYTVSKHAVHVHGPPQRGQ